MPIGTITMILTNVGLQIYNNWCSSRQNEKLRQKREEFERAARDRNTEHMWELMREGQELTMQLEKEKHDDRLKELKDEVDHLLERLTYEATISNWPLKVLPIVMKNQALGNLLANQEEHVAMHVILTRSNYNKFNKSVFPIVEKQLEQYCDQHWSTMTDHPVLFYSGSWKPMSCPTDVQVTAMREELKNLPTLLITPFFRPGDGKLVFQVHMWGVGANSSDQFSVPEIEPVNDEFHFQRTYNNQQDYENEEGLLDDVVEDLVPYLECMIGYMADTYFWTAFGSVPQFPLMLADGTINTDGMKYLVNDCQGYYERLLATTEENAKANPFAENNSVALLDGLSTFLSAEEKETGLKRLFSEYCSVKLFISNDDVSELINNASWGLCNLQFISTIVNYADKQNFPEYQGLKPIIEMLTSINHDYSILDIKDIPSLKELADSGNAVALYRLGEVHEYGMRVPIDEELACHYYQESAEKGFILGELKVGKMEYKDISSTIDRVLRSMNILQYDVLYSDEIIKNQHASDSKTEEAVERLSKTIMSNITTGRAYSHAGLLYNLAALKIRKKDYRTAKSMSELAVKLGYTKALQLINN